MFFQSHLVHYLEYFYRARDQNSNIQYYLIYSKLALRLSSYFFLHQSTSVLQKDDMFTFAYLTIGIHKSASWLNKVHLYNLKVTLGRAAWYS